MTRGHAHVLFCACLSLLLGCGARSSTLEDEESLGGESSGNAGGTTSGGRPSGGASSGGMTSGGRPSGGTGNVSSAGFGAGGASGGFGAAGGNGGVASGGVAGVGAFGAQGGSGGAAAGAGGAGGASEVIVRACVAVLASECAPCLCQTCAPALLDCFSDLGCAVIFSCAQQTKCAGLRCYSPDTCGPVIDQFGGPFGQSARNVFSLASCSVNSRNNCGCN